MQASAVTLPAGQEQIYGLVSEGSIPVADELLQDVWDLGPRSHPVHIAPITWREDPFHDSYWRSLYYALRPTSNLLYAYYSTGDKRYRDKLISILDSYCTYDASRPVDRDKFDNRYSSAFRAMVLVNSYVKLARSGDLPAPLSVELRAAIERIGNFLALAVNFEPNQNHGISEAAALALVAVNFPALAEAPGWRSLGLQRLASVMTTTVDADGVEIENTPFYHFYALTFAREIDGWATKYNIGLSPEFRKDTNQMVKYATHIVQPNSKLPLLGSGVESSMANQDTGVYSKLGEEFPEFEYTYTSGVAGTAPSRRNVMFPISGQSMMRSAWSPAADFKNDSQVTFNVGRWRSRHCHLDVLGINYYSAGRTLVTDSGLYTSNAGADFDFFTGTRAHNTVVVDGKDQSTGSAVVEGLTATGVDWAYQSGAHDLYAGVTHRRSVVLLRRDLLLVVDTLSGSAPHRFQQLWHLFPGAAPRASGTSIDVSEGKVQLLAIRQSPPARLAVDIVTGQTNPEQGFYSEAYGKKVANSVIEYSTTGSSAQFVTLLASGALARFSPTVTATTDGTGAKIHAQICAGGMARSIDITNQARAGETVKIGTGVCP